MSAAWLAQPSWARGSPSCSTCATLSCSGTRRSLTTRVAPSTAATPRMSSPPLFAPWGSEMSSQLVTFTLAGARFGIDMFRVHEALRGQARTTIPLSEPAVAGFINLRGQGVLTIDRRPRLAIGAPPAALEPMMLVVEVDSEPVSLLL